MKAIFEEHFIDCSSIITSNGFLFFIQNLYGIVELNFNLHLFFRIVQRFRFQIIFSSISPMLYPIQIERKLKNRIDVLNSFAFHLEFLITSCGNEQSNCSAWNNTVYNHRLFGWLYICIPVCLHSL